MTFEEKLDPKHTAVLVIDMQHDFCVRDGAFERANPGIDLKPIDEMVPRLAKLLDNARTYGVPVIYVTAIYNSDDDRYLSPVMLEHQARRRRGLYTTVPLCKEDSWGAEIIPALAPRDDELVVVKHRYSAFIDTPLQAYLRNRGIKTIVVTGVATHGCVESTVRDGFMLDHYTVTVGDCVSTYWSDAHVASLKMIDLLFGEVRDSQSIIEAWNGVSVSEAKKVAIST